MARRIIWSPTALADLKAVLQYWEKRIGNKTYSKKLNRLIRAEMKKVGQQHYIGRATDQENLRELIVKDYLIAYKVLEEEITVMYIFDTRRNPEDNPLNQ